MHEIFGIVLITAALFLSFMCGLLVDSFIRDNKNTNKRKSAGVISRNQARKEKEKNIREYGTIALLFLVTSIFAACWGWSSL